MKDDEVEAIEDIFDRRFRGRRIECHPCPLAEIAPNFVHSLLKMEIVDILAACEDSSDVRRWNPNAGVPMTNGEDHTAEDSVAEAHTE